MDSMSSSTKKIDFDKLELPKNKTRADYLVVAAGEQAFCWVAVLELKKGALNANQVAKQLQAGALDAEKIVHPKAAFEFRPIAVCGSVSEHQKRNLRKKLIMFRGKKEIIRWMKCGKRLVDVLDS